MWVRYINSISIYARNATNIRISDGVSELAEFGYFISHTVSAVVEPLYVISSAPAQLKPN